VAAWLEAGDLAHAGIEAVMLRLPDVDADALAKLATLADLEKGGTSWQDEPRIPAGQPGGGQWTTGGGAAAPSPNRPHSLTDANGDPQQVTVPSRVRESKTENASGFYPNSTGGGVLYIPSVSDGQSIRATEVHVLDASAFQVGWTDDTITLRDRMGHLYAVSANDLEHFNATTGQVLGVSIYAFPGERLAAPDAPPTAAEQRQFDQARADFDAGVQASEQSLSGRVTTGAVLVTVALPFIALTPVAVQAAPKLFLTTPEANESAIALARRLGAEGEEAVGITGPKVAIEIPGSGQVRVPDGFDTDAKVLTEVKNAAQVNFTQQLRDFWAFCQANGYGFELYVRPSTNFSRALSEAIMKGEIKLKYIPGAR
jgi:hypothetical protein